MAAVAPRTHCGGTGEKFPEPRGSPSPPAIVGGRRGGGRPPVAGAGSSLPAQRLRPSILATRSSGPTPRLQRLQRRPLPAVPSRAITHPLPNPGTRAGTAEAPAGHGQPLCPFLPSPRPRVSLTTQYTPFRRRSAQRLRSRGAGRGTGGQEQVAGYSPLTASSLNRSRAASACTLKSKPGFGTPWWAAPHGPGAGVFGILPPLSRAATILARGPVFLEDTLL